MTYISYSTIGVSVWVSVWVSPFCVTQLVGGGTLRFAGTDESAPAERCAGKAEQSAAVQGRNAKHVEVAPPADSECEKGSGRAWR